MNKKQLLNDENIHRKIKEEMLDKCFNSQLLDSYGFDEKEIIKSHNILTKMEELLDENCKIIIKSERQLDDLLGEKGYTKYVGLNYNRSDLEKQFPFFKKFWYRGVSYYSYSIKQINDYFGKRVLEDNTPMTAYVINYLIFLYNKLKYWDEFN